MYKHILVALENGPADEDLLTHVKALAMALHSQMLLLHVADGFAARHHDTLDLADSEEMKIDKNYLEKVAGQLHSEGLVIQTHMAFGNPPEEIVKVAEKEGCDLIAMGAHGHKFLGDLVHGSTVTPVRHHTRLPVLVVRTSGK